MVAVVAVLLGPRPQSRGALGAGWRDVFGTHSLAFACGRSDTTSVQSAEVQREVPQGCGKRERQQQRCPGSGRTDPGDRAEVGEG